MRRFKLRQGFTLDMGAEMQIGLHAKCPLPLTYANENLHSSTELRKNFEY